MYSLPVTAHKAVFEGAKVVKKSQESVVRNLEPGPKL
jgi:hypothetical protein